MKFSEKIKNGDVYIIAEMSANHGGEIERAIEIIEVAAKAGADCVKTQTYTADTLTLDCDLEAYRLKGGLWDGYNYYSLYKEAYTPWEWQPVLKEKCEELGMDFLSTPFDRTAVDFLENMNVEFYKIASFELVDIPLIEYVASKGKPIVMSCGMASVEEIDEAVNACKKYGNENIVLLKCCSQYPAQPEDMNLAVIPDMKTRFNKVVGLSDHSFGSLAPVIAVSLGAQVIEKHICLSRDIDTPDSGFSMSVEEFAGMVQDVRNAKIFMGSCTYELTEHEKNGLNSRRSLVACADIKKGDVFTEHNIKSVRPAIGILPKYYDKLLGKRAKKDYKFGEPLCFDEVE